MFKRHKKTYHKKPNNGNVVDKYVKYLENKLNKRTKMRKAKEKIDRCANYKEPKKGFSTAMKIANGIGGTLVMAYVLSVFARNNNAKQMKAAPAPLHDLDGRTDTSTAQQKKFIPCRRVGRNTVGSQYQLVDNHNQHVPGLPYNPNTQLFVKVQVYKAELIWAQNIHNFHVVARVVKFEPYGDLVLESNSMWKRWIKMYNRTDQHSLLKDFKGTVLEAFNDFPPDMQTHILRSGWNNFVSNDKQNTVQVGLEDVSHIAPTRKEMQDAMK